jgi:hypothetical protein
VPTFELLQCEAIATGSGAATLAISYSVADRRVGSTASFSCNSGYAVSAPAVQTCRETSNTSVQWQVGGPSWVPASSPVCGDINECLAGGVCTGTGNRCNNTTGSFTCDCQAGWYTNASTLANVPVTGANATCSAACGDSLVRGAEACDNGAGNRATAPPCEAASCAYCTTSCANASAGPTALSCTNGLDDDASLLTDCEDRECANVGGCYNWTCNNQLEAYVRNLPTTFAAGQLIRSLPVTTTGRPRNFPIPLTGSAPSTGVLFTAPVDGYYELAACTFSGGLDPVMAWYSEAFTCGGATDTNHWGYVDDNAYCASRPGNSGTNGTALGIHMYAGQSIINAVAGYSGSSGTYNLDIYAGCASGLWYHPTLGCISPARDNGVCDANWGLTEWFDWDFGDCYCNPQNGSNSTASGGAVRPGLAITNTCNSGFVASSGNASRTCQANGTLSGTALACVRNCGAAPTISNNGGASPSSTDCTTQGCSTYYGNFCTNNHNFVGTWQSVCQSSGSWSGTAERTCVQNTFQEPNKVNGTNPTNGGEANNTSGGASRLFGVFNQVRGEWGNGTVRWQDVDWYYFDVPYTTQMVFETAAENSTGFPCGDRDTNLQLFASSNLTTPVAQDSTSGDQNCSMLFYTVTPGRWYIRHSHIGTSSGNRFHLLRTMPVITEAEPNNSTGVPSYLLIWSNTPDGQSLWNTFGGAVGRGSITAGDNDYWQFYVPGRAEYRFRTSAQGGDGEATCTMDTFIHLLNSSGTEITSNDDDGPGSCSSITRTLDPGWYWIRVRGYLSTTTGTYDLRVVPDDT